MSAAEQLPADEPERHLELVEPEPECEPEHRPGRVAAMASELRPYLPTASNLRGPLAGVGAGSRILAGRGWAWLWADGVEEAGIRGGGIAVGVYAGIHTLAALPDPYTPYIAPAAVVGWCVAAKLHAPKRREKQPVKGKPTPIIEDQDGDELEPEGIEAEDVTALIRAVAARHQHQGAHLETLLAEPLFTGWEKGELKAALTGEWGLPVESFKLLFDGRQRVRDGVRLRHLPPAPARGLFPAPVEAPASTPPEAPAGVGVEAAAAPSPTAPPGPSQDTG